MAEYEKEVRKILKENGYVLSRPDKGSHDIWHNPILKNKVTVPQKIKSRHTANEILKQSGINHKF